MLSPSPVTSGIRAWWRGPKRGFSLPAVAIAAVLWSAGSFCPGRAQSPDTSDLSSYPELADSMAIDRSALIDAFDSLPLSHFPPRSDSGDSNMSLPHENQSDLDHDGDVDIEDLDLFSSRWLGVDVASIDWCQWINEDSKKQRHRDSLIAFVKEYYRCGWHEPPQEDPFTVKHENRFPVRLAAGLGGGLYVTDAKAGSVFRYDTSLTVTGELKGMVSPLGVAVDPQGTIYVGNSGSHNVEVYSADGRRVRILGEGLIAMPNDLALDRNNRLYVVDSGNDKVWVFDSAGNLAGTIGRTGNYKGELRFPVAVEIAYRYDAAAGMQTGELYVADQGHSLIQVYDLQGTYLRAFGGAPVQGRMGMGWNWYGKFVKLQSLSMDTLGRLHAVDSYANRIQILNPVSGAYLSSYGSTGVNPGQFLLPLDVLAATPRGIVVSNYMNNRLENIPSP